MLQQPAILKALSTKKAYKQHIDKLSKHPLSAEGKWILDNYASWYEEKDKDIDFNVFGDYCFAVKHPNLSIEKKELYNAIIENIISADDTLADDIIHNWCRDDRVIDIEYAINNYLDGNATIDSVSEAIRVAGDLDAVDDIDEDILTFDNLEFTEENSAKYKWSLDCLNKCTDGIGAGNLAIIFALSNVGKTSFIINEANNILKQLPENKYILWLNNEESLKDIYVRHMACYTGRPTSEVRQNYIEYKKIFLNKYKGDRIIGLQSSKITKSKVESLIDRYPPALIIFNNLDKVKRDSGVALHKELGDLYQWGRELAITHNAAVMAVCQANAEAIGRIGLTQNMLQDSKVDKSGEADIIIGISREEPTSEDASNRKVPSTEYRDDKGRVNRYINICKNKLGEGSEEGLRESYCNLVLFNTRTGKYEDNEVEAYD